MIWHTDILYLKVANQIKCVNFERAGWLARGMELWAAITSVVWCKQSVSHMVHAACLFGWIPQAYRSISWVWPEYYQNTKSFIHLFIDLLIYLWLLLARWLEHPSGNQRVWLSAIRFSLVHMSRHPWAWASIIRYYIYYFLIYIFFFFFSTVFTISTHLQHFGNCL